MKIRDYVCKFLEKKEFQVQNFGITYVFSKVRKRDFQALIFDFTYVF